MKRKPITAEAKFLTLNPSRISCIIDESKKKEQHDKKKILKAHSTDNISTKIYCLLTPLANQF